MAKVLNCFFFANRLAQEAAEWKCWESIPLEGVTHLTWAFFKPAPDGSIEIPCPRLHESQLPDAVRKAHRAGVKIILSIGGWSDSVAYPEIARHPGKIRRFTDACLALVSRFGFDGIDIDWEYPGFPPHGGTPFDPANCILLVSELGRALAAEGKELNLDVPGRPIEGIQGGQPCGFDLAALSQWVDRFNVMAYDMWSPPQVEGIAEWHASALYDDGDPRHWSVSRSLDHHLSSGIAPDKLTLGLALYGRGYRNCSGLGKAFSGLGGHRGGGLWSFKQIRDLERTVGIEPEWCKAAGVPTAFQSGYHQVPIKYRGGREWISYEDAQSLELKCRKAFETGLGGVSVWDATFDDYGSGYPLLNAIRDCIP